MKNTISLHFIDMFDTTLQMLSNHSGSLCMAIALRRVLAPLVVNVRGTLAGFFMYILLISEDQGHLEDGRRLESIVTYIELIGTR